jgi:hypothetical protein
MRSSNPFSKASTAVLPSSPENKPSFVCWVYHMFAPASSVLALTDEELNNHKTPHQDYMSATPLKQILLHYDIA